MPIERRYEMISGDSFGNLTGLTTPERIPIVVKTWRYCEIAHETEIETACILTRYKSAASAPR